MSDKATAMTAEEWFASPRYEIEVLSVIEEEEAMAQGRDHQTQVANAITATFILEYEARYGEPPKSQVRQK